MNLDERSKTLRQEWQDLKKRKWEAGERDGKKLVELSRQMFRKCEHNFWKVIAKGLLTIMQVGEQEKTDKPPTGSSPFHSNKP